MIEWYSDIGIETIVGLLKHVEKSYGGVLCRGNENYADRWRQYLKKRKRGWSYERAVNFFP